jgi:hypothetical protein
MIATQEVGDYLEFVPDVATDYGTQDARRSVDRLLAGNRYVYNGGTDGADRTFDMRLKLTATDALTLQSIYDSDDFIVLALPIGSYLGRIGAIELSEWPIRFEFWPSEQLRSN